MMKYGDRDSGNGYLENKQLIKKQTAKNKTDKKINRRLKMDESLYNSKEQIIIFKHLNAES